jgi:hypothetical protein
MGLRVSEEHMKRIVELRAHADRLAFMVGVAAIEHRDADRRLTAEGNGAPDKLRYGALHIEHAQKSAFFMLKVDEVRVQQKEAGETALRAVGIDFDKGEYTIDMQTGDVKELVSGEWKAVETA